MCQGSRTNADSQHSSQEGRTHQGQAWTSTPRLQMDHMHSNDILLEIMWVNKTCLSPASLLPQALVPKVTTDTVAEWVSYPFPIVSTPLRCPPRATSYWATTYPRWRINGYKIYQLTIQIIKEGLYTVSFCMKGMQISIIIIIITATTFNQFSFFDLTCIWSKPNKISLRGITPKCQQ